MSSHNPLVSVCIPNYNNGSYLAQAVESALQQTVNDLEVIICDNQSTDNSLEVARSFTDDRVRVYVNDRNLGIYGNFERITELARGKYLKFLCADDWLASDYLEVTLAYFDKYPEAGLVTTRQMVLTDKGKTITVRKEAIPGKEIYSSEEYLNAVLRRINPIGNPTRAIVRRDVFDAVSGFDPKNEYAGDLDLWLKIAAQYCIAAIPKILCYERKHPNQNTHQHVQQATDIRDICLAVKKSFQELPEYWTLERRVTFCRHALSPYVRRAIKARLQGNLPYWTSTVTYISELCPRQHWLPYSIITFPFLEVRLFLLRKAKIMVTQVKRFRS